MSDVKIQFYLKNNGRLMREIILSFSFGYKQINNLTGKTVYKPLLYNTGVKTTTDNWDQENSLPTKTSELVSVLKVKEMLETLYSSLMLKDVTISPDLLKDEMDLLLGREKKVKTVTKVSDFIYEFILEREEKKPEEEYTYKKPTRKNNKSLYNKILDFEKASKKELYAETLDKQTFLLFQTYCQDTTKKNNTAWSYIKNFVAALRKIADKYEISVFIPSNNSSQKLVITSKDEDKLYLSFEEIQIIIDYHPPNEKLRLIKLMFLTLLFSGARFSDLHKVKPNYLYEKSSLKFYYAQFITTKNPTMVVVPFVKPLIEAWDKSQRKSIPKMAIQEFNDEVKVLCRLAGFTEIKKVVYTNSKGVKEFDEKAHFKFISSHIGRRSFITNFINVVSPTLITKITGHTFKMQDVVFLYNKLKPLKGAVLFMKFAKKLYEDEDWKEEFPIKLVA